MGYPVETVQIEALSELLVVGKQVVEGIGKPRTLLRLVIG